MTLTLIGTDEREARSQPLQKTSQ